VDVVHIGEVSDNYLGPAAAQCLSARVRAVDHRADG
jgi:hypothetical protein